MGNRKIKNNIMLLCCTLFLVAALMQMGVAAGEVKEMIGAGATFPYPLYSKWFDVYNKETGIKINYQSIGSGGGIQQLQNEIVDFGASDAFLSEEEMKAFKAEVLHIPTAIGGVAVIYNVDDPKLKIKLTGDLLAKIYLGEIKFWNDAALQKANPDVKLPKLPIIVTHRSEGSGTTSIFTEYLEKVSPTWKGKVGSGKSVSWPCGIGGKGNEGVAGLIKQMKGTIGYGTTIYASENKLSYCSIQNKSGNFVYPTLISVSASAKGNVPTDLRVSITDTDAKDGYPISGFTWLLINKEQNYGKRSKAQAQATVKFAKWAISDAQQYNESLLYSKIPDNVSKMAMDLVNSMTYNGEKLN